MIYDQNFLSKLVRIKHKVVYAKITALTFDERPVQTIEGRVTQGSVNIDGASAVRRTCSLSIVAQNFKYDDYYWGLNTKFKLEVGLKNNINSIYPDIIWFNQGLFLITTFNTSRTVNNFTIQISGKDKMALLNGEIGGSVEGKTDFGTIQEETIDGIWEIRKIPIYEIIRNAVHIYAKEPYHNIIINDLDVQGLELLEYRQDQPLYVYREINSNIYHNATLDGEKMCNVYLPDSDGRVSTFYKICPLKELTNLDLETLINISEGSKFPKIIEFVDMDVTERKFYYVAKLEYGQAAGYRETDLVFNGDLIANIGETITSVFDKIIKMLGRYEYFYNVDGQFVFQKKKDYVDVDWSPIAQSNNETYITQENEEYSYLFNDLETITSFSKNPNLLNLKNDYSVWGTKISSDSKQYPIHIRYAIDKKPTRYTVIKVNEEEVKSYNEKYGTALKKQYHYTYTTEKYDWREIIYRMAADFLAYGHLDDFETKIVEANGDLYPGGRTGYEAYYSDLIGFWRELYNPDIENDIIKIRIQIENATKEANEEKDPILLRKKISQIETLEERLREALENAKNFYYYVYDENENPIYTVQNLGKAYDAQGNLVYDNIKLTDENGQFNPESYVYLTAEAPVLLESMPIYDNVIIKEIRDKETLKKIYDSIGKEEEYIDNDVVYFKYIETVFTNERLYWNRSVYESPWDLNFWFDFLDSGGELASFSVPMIGNRPKVVNDNEVKSIYFRETPEIIFYQDDGSEKKFNEREGFKYLQIPEEYFSISAQGRSAKDKLNDLIYQHSYCIESSTITTIPIYYLQPNTKIYLCDETLGLNGDYIISKITVPLTYNATMQLIVTKAAQRII